MLSAIGDLTFNLSGGFDNLSDFGTLGNWTGGLVWKPSESLTLQGTYIERESAPSLAQLGGPQLTSYNVPVYDFTTGRTALVTQTSGGNPDLKAEHQRDFKLSASYDLHFLDRANILVEYYHNRSTLVTAAFPLLTPAIEAAFPGRVTRGVSGQLLAIDARPVTFAEYPQRSHSLWLQSLRQGRKGLARCPAAWRPRALRTPDGGRSASGGGDAQSPRGGRTGPANGATGDRPGFDPQRFAQLRQQFCAAPAGQFPDLSALPQSMQDRLKGADGKPDPAKIAAMRSACAVPRRRSGSIRADCRDP